MKKVVSSIYAVGLIIIFISCAEGNRGYSYADCTYVKSDYASTYYGGRCFCYTSPAIRWKDYWSTFQVHVSSQEDVVIVYPMETRTCHDVENLLKLATCLMEHYWPSSVQKEKTADVPLIEEEVYFMVRSPRASAEYTLHVSKHRFNRMRFFLFVSGLTLFFFAGAICRSSLFFYISGISLGIVSIFVFLLLVLKNFIPTRGLFLLLFGAGSGLSYLGIQKLINERDEIMRLYWRELLGYLLVSGFVSLAVCYRLGPVTNRRTLNVMTWALQVAGVLVACHGVTYTHVSWILLAVLLGFKILPLLFALILAVWRQTCWLLSTFLGLFQRKRSSKSRLLTEEEYREQAERHTKASLEELRRYCTNPGFPAWDTVLRLRAPQRFAEFLRSGAHITPSELQSHEQHHSFGAEYAENTLLDSTHTTATSEDFSDNETNTHTHRSLNPNPFTTLPSLPALPALPSLPALPALPSLPAMPTPPAYTASICPYPPTPYPPAPERPLTDDDEPF
ncbi:LOW QUALITY PROTEIN: nuclear envelope integral membrane protein 2 [Pangasianodon hypophthalmus]|uniref:LOW QUALITY PROTEIN: nuclear envelope integral membrane protein 2 n=1 Tax=Pangasianodon hypophthalmus TaxID=310915 RepID=UPI002307F593|nr:LOW QUALITY PROTEIN: nuclear envelope integral membrane protein 2 [Pangasianodon hypophthalmus]